MTLPLDQQPAEFSPAAQAYIVANADSINQVAQLLGVSASGIAGSIGREITRTSFLSALNTVGHEVAVALLLSTSNANLQLDFAIDEAKFFANPAAFEGDNRGKFAAFTDSMAVDIGPGHINVLTAIQTVDLYAQAYPSLGLQQYIDNPLALVQALVDQNSDVTIKIAGLIALQAQQFFQNGGAPGIDWNALSADQQNALVVSYYTTGQTQIQTDVRDNAYNPFSSGDPTGAAYYLFANNPSLVASALSNNVANFSSTVVNPDGSQTITETTTIGGGLLTKTVISISADGNETQITRYGNGNLNSPYQTEDIVSTGNTTVDTVANFDTAFNFIGGTQTTTTNTRLGTAVQTKKIAPVGGRGEVIDVKPSQEAARDICPAK